MSVRCGASGRFEGGLNRYGYVEGNPVLWSDPFGLSAADVQRIVDTYNNTVKGMTNDGSRNENSLINNLASTLDMISGGLLGAPYLGCGDQEGVVRDQLDKNKYDDNWDFQQDSSLVHKWGEGSSDNPSDPKIIYDPWKDKLIIEYPSDKNKSDDKSKDASSSSGHGGGGAVGNIFKM